MIHVPTIIVSATVGLALGASLGFAQDIAFFAAQDSLDEVISRLQSAGEGQLFNNPSLDADRTRAVRALASRLLTKAELEGYAARTDLH